MKRLAALLCLGLAACGGGGGGDGGGGGGGGGGNTPLTIAPAQVSLDPGMAKTFSGAGGSKPYSYSIASGGGSIDATSGAYTAPASAGSAVIRVTDASAQHADASVTINPPLTLVAPATMVDGNTSQTLIAGGGQAPYSFSIASGTGKVDASSGAYTAPVEAGTSVIQVSDALGATAQVTIINNPQLLVTPTSITVTAGAGQTYPFAGVGGAPPYQFSLVSGPGSLSQDGVYTAANTSGTATIQVTDGLGYTSHAAVRSLRIRVNGGVSTSVSDGTNLFLGGDFTAGNPQSAPRLLIADSTTGDQPLACDLQSGFLDGHVSAVLTTPTAIYVGGEFAQYRGTQVGGLAKIDPTTCQLDPTFNPPGLSDGGLDGYGEVSALLLSGDSLYAAGAFNGYRGTTVRAVIKISAKDGTLDPQFSQTSGSGAVTSLALVGNSLFVGGAETDYDGVAVPHLAKVDATTGHVDPSWGQGAHPDGLVSTIVASGNTLYVGGWFKHYGSLAASLVKLDATTGVADATFAPHLSSYGLVGKAVLSGSSLIVGFSVTGSPGSFLALAKMDAATGAIDSGFAQPGDIDGDVSAVAVSGGWLYAGGDFQHYRGVPAYGLAKISLANAALDTTFTRSTGVNGVPVSIAFCGSNVVAGGQFSTYRGMPLRHLAKLDISSDVFDPAFTALGGADGPVYSLALTNGSLYIGGNYTTLHGFSRGGLGKINPASGAVDSAFAPSNSHLSARAILPFGGAIYVGGQFFAYDGQITGPVVKINPATGHRDSTFAPVTDGSVFALAASGSSIYVGGAFGDPNNPPATNVEKVDSTTGALDTAFGQTVGASSPLQVYSLALSGSSLYVGGTIVSGSDVLPSLFKLDATTGSADSAFSQPTGQGPNGRINVMTSSGSSLYIGGVFATLHTATAENLAKLDATTAAADAVFTTTSGVCDALISLPPCGGNVSSLTVVGSRLYVGSQAASSYRGDPAYFLFPVDVTSGALLDP